MRDLKHIALISLSLTAATVWAGKEQSGIDQASHEKAYIFSSQSMKTTALVAAIDHETRIVTLRGPQGDSFTLTVSEDARNLDQVKVGDIVNAEFIHSLSIEVITNPGLQAGEGEITVVGRSAKGEMPGMIVTESYIETATVEEINLESNTFKLKGPDGLDRRLRPPLFHLGSLIQFCRTLIISYTYSK